MVRNEKKLEKFPIKNYNNEIEDIHIFKMNIDRDKNYWTDQINDLFVLLAEKILFSEALVTYQTLFSTQIFRTLFLEFLKSLLKK